MAMLIVQRRIFIAPQAIIPDFLISFKMLNSFNGLFFVEDTPRKHGPDGLYALKLVTLFELQYDKLAVEEWLNIVKILCLSSTASFSPIMRKDMSSKAVFLFVEPITIMRRSFVPIFVKVDNGYIAATVYLKTENRSKIVKANIPSSMYRQAIIIRHTAYTASCTNLSKLCAIIETFVCTFKSFFWCRWIFLFHSIAEHAKFHVIPAPLFFVNLSFTFYLDFIEIFMSFFAHNDSCVVRSISRLVEPGEKKEALLHWGQVPSRQG